jgi:hypothetical protein
MDEQIRWLRVRAGMSGLIIFGLYLVGYTREANAY